MSHLARMQTLPYLDVPTDTCLYATEFTCTMKDMLAKSSCLQASGAYM